MLTHTELAGDRASNFSLRAESTAIEWHPALPVCASEEFLRAVGDEYGWLAGVNEAGLRRCILPYTILHKPGFRCVHFRVETIPLVDDLSVAEERSFLNSALLHFRARGAAMVLPAANTALFRTYPDGAVFAPYGTLVNDLRRPEDVLWRATSEAYRKDIRRAKKAGVRIEEGNQYLDIAYELFAQTMRRSHASAKRYADFKALVSGLGDRVKILLAIHESIPQACLILPFSQHTAYTMYGGTAAQPTKGAMHLLHWEAMRQFRNIGVQRFNFTGVRIHPQRGSKQEGILTFKARFGGELLQGYTWKYCFNRLKFVAYSVAISLLKGGDTVDQERHKLESL